MAARVGFIVVDSQDPARLADFWCNLLQTTIEANVGSGEFLILAPAGGGVTIGFQRVPEAKAGKNRLHLDLVVDDLDDATAEVERLGGRWLEPGTTRELEGFFWRCLADPEGNEFDIDLVPAAE
jgi:predicted enzyme related to lactoylglutathione lyase